MLPMNVHSSPFFLNPPFTQQIQTYPGLNYPLLPPNYPNYLLSHSRQSHLPPLPYSQPALNNVRHPEVHVQQVPQSLRSVKPLMTDKHDVLTADMVFEILSIPWLQWTGLKTFRGVKEEMCGCIKLTLNFTLKTGGMEVTCKYL